MTTALLLSITEEQELAAHEAIIERGLKAFVDVGQALLAIRDARLYRAQFGTFEDYCRDRWGMSRIHAHRLIEAAGVTENLLPMGNILPESERQARPLTQLPPDVQPVVWQRAVDTAPNGKITAAHVQNIVDEYKAPAKPVLIAHSEEEVIEAARTIRAQQREAQREVIRTRLENVAVKEAKTITGVYDVIVIDPPWPMVKIERDERPNQVEFDYPTMSLEEITTLELPCADDCHVWLWTTHKYLPEAMGLLAAWGLKYVCTFVWHKPGGFQPYGLPQFNCEFALYARKGAPVFLDTKAFATCFSAERNGHSVKPQEFYDLVTRTTAGRRLDMFNRRPIVGFDGWGKEA